MQILKESPISIYKAISVPSIDYAVNNSTPTINTIKRQINEKQAIVIIAEAIKDLSLFFNVGKNMTTEQMFITAELINESYGFLRLSEIKFCFNNIKKGKYGKLYDRLDGSLILECLESYLSERESYYVNKNINDKSNYNRLEISEQALKIIVDVIPVVEPKQVQREKTSEELLINGLMIEFDKLYNANEITHGGQRFVNYNASTLTIEEYCTLRLKELATQ
jgi:hypothetical protein